MLELAAEHAEEVRRHHTRRLAAQSAVAGAVSVNLPAAVMVVASDVALVVRGRLHAAAHTLNVFGTPADHPTLIHAAVKIVAGAGATDSERRQATLVQVVRYLTSSDTQRQRRPTSRA